MVGYAQYPIIIYITVFNINKPNFDFFWTGLNGSLSNMVEAGLQVSACINGKN